MTAAVEPPTRLAPEEVKDFLSVAGPSSKDALGEKRGRVRLDLEWRDYESMVYRGKPWPRI